MPNPVMQHHSAFDPLVCHPAVCDLPCLKPQLNKGIEPQRKPLTKMRLDQRWLGHLAKKASLGVGRYVLGTPQKKYILIFVLASLQTNPKKSSMQQQKRQSHMSCRNFWAQPSRPTFSRRRPTKTTAHVDRRTDGPRRLWTALNSGAGSVVSTVDQNPPSAPGFPCLRLGGETLKPTRGRKVFFNFGGAQSCHILRGPIQE